MPYIVCEDCKKRYDYEKDEFCPRCGCFNQPVKTWGVDAKGNVIRVDGINERDHDHSFVHDEVHHEKSVRRATGLDWQTGRRPAPPPQSGAYRQKNAKKGPLLTVFIIIAVIFFVNFILPLLFMLLE